MVCVRCFLCFMPQRFCRAFKPLSRTQREGILALNACTRPSWRLPTWRTSQHQPLQQVLSLLSLGPPKPPFVSQWLQCRQPSSPPSCVLVKGCRSQRGRTPYFHSKHSPVPHSLTCNRCHMTQSSGQSTFTAGTLHCAHWDTQPKHHGFMLPLLCPATNHPVVVPVPFL